MQSFALLCSIIIILFTSDNPHHTVENYIQEDTQKFKELFTVFHRMIKSSRILFMFIFTTVTVSTINVIFTLLPNYFSKIGLFNSINSAIFMLFNIVGA